MKNILITAFIFLFCSHATLSAAVEQSPQSIRALIALGLESNLGLQIDLIDTAKAAESINIEDSAFDNTLFATTGYWRSSIPYESSFSSASQSDSDQLSGEVGIRKRFKTGLTTSLSLDSEWVSDNDLSDDLDPRYRTALSLDLSQPLLRDLGTSVNTTRLAISRNQQRQVSLGYLLQAQNLILQLEAVARQLAAKTKIIHLRQQALDLAAELFVANQKRFKIGVIPVSEIQEAETALAARQLALSQAIQDRDLLFEDLNRQLNYRLSTEFSAEPLVNFDQTFEPIELPDFDQLLESAQQKRLELKINDYVVQNSSLQQNYLQNQLKPQLDLKFQAGINGLSGDERSSVVASRYSGDWLDSIGSMSAADGYHWRVGLEFSMPLDNRSAKSHYRQAKLQLKQDNYRQKDLQAMIKNDLLQQQVNISRTKEQLEITERFEVLAEKSLKQEQRRLQEGLSDTFRMIFFQQKMIEAKIERINAITRYHLALAQLDFAAGRIFERHNIILTNNTEELTLENI
ncbi:MAG: TolC family protein [Desulfuromusa sp.]